jgi:hypothetical protein
MTLKYFHPPLILTALKKTVKSQSGYLSIYGSTAFVELGRLFSFLIHTQSVGLLGQGSARRKAATYTQDSIDIK